MNAKRIVALLALTLFLFAGVASAQEKNPPPPPPPRPVDAEVSVVMPLRIQVVFSEYDGEKKISSLPYTLNHNATRGNSRTSLRMGLRVPIVTAPAKEGLTAQVQYHNVGTDIDCLVTNRDGLFLLHLELRRSSVYTPDAGVAGGVPGGLPGGAVTQKLRDSKAREDIEVGGVPSNPVIREFSGAVDALLRDGQTVQSTMATDPVSGRVLRVDVTLNVIK